MMINYNSIMKWTCKCCNLYINRIYIYRYFELFKNITLKEKISMIENIILGFIG